MWRRAAGSSKRRDKPAAYLRDYWAGLLVPPAPTATAATTAVAVATSAAGSALCGVAVRAVYRAIAPRLERNLGLLATLRADRREHLPPLATTVATAAAVATAATVATAAAVATRVAALCLSRRSAFRAPARLIRVPALGVELLLPSGECERPCAVPAS